MHSIPVIFLTRYWTNNQLNLHLHSHGLLVLHLRCLGLLHLRCWSWAGVNSVPSGYLLCLHVYSRWLWGKLWGVVIVVFYLRLWFLILFQGWCNICPKPSKYSPCLNKYLWEHFQPKPFSKSVRAKLRPGELSNKSFNKYLWHLQI